MSNLHSRGAPNRYLFYARPVPISRRDFMGKSFAIDASFSFAQDTNVVPLNANEFALAQHHYPIVFGADAEASPLAVLGLHKGQNTFVDTAGRWRASVYVPAYVRRYPFILMRGQELNDFVLCADIEASCIVDTDTNPFYQDGGPSGALQKAAAFCRAFQADANASREFCVGLSRQKLFRSTYAEISPPGVRRIRLGPFQIVDEGKFARLPRDVVADWFGRGWLRHIHAHLFSLANWSRLASGVNGSSSD